MSDIADVIGNPTELGVVEAVWACANDGIPASAENVEWYVMRFWTEGAHESITPEDARRYIGAALNGGDVSMAVDANLNASLSLPTATAATVGRRYAYWTDQRERRDEAQVHRAVFYALDQYHAGTGEWPVRDDLVRAVMKHCHADIDTAREVVGFGISEGVLTAFVESADRTDYPEIPKYLDALAPFWRLRPSYLKDFGDDPVL